MPHPFLTYSSNKITWSMLLIQNHIRNGKQCRWRSVGKPTYLILHCLQRQDISGFCRTRVKFHAMALKSPFHQSDFLFHFRWDHLVHSDILENGTPLKSWRAWTDAAPKTTSLTYEESQWKQDANLRVFLCFRFARASVIDFCVLSNSFS